jgi:hypothetical protein
MVQPDPFDVVSHAVSAALADGPLPLDELAHLLVLNGALEAFGELDDDADVIELVDEILLGSDDTWMSDDGLVALTAPMLDGVVFCHRVSDSEITRGVLDAAPDLGFIDYDVADGLEVAGGGTLECRYPFEGEAALDENGSFVVPAHWMASLQAGNLVSLRRIGRTVSLEVVAAPGPGTAEVEALKQAFAIRHIEGVGVEPHELVLDALCHDSDLFRNPVLPVGELLELAGLERRDAWFGQRGEDWESPGFRYLEREMEYLRESWGFDSCCDAAFETVRKVWGDHVLGRSEPTRDSLRLVARDLGHGSVAPAFAEYVLGQRDHGSESLAAFAQLVSSVAGRHAAAGYYLQAMDAEREGSAGAAEEHLHHAARTDPDYGPALAELAWYEADHGDAAKAISLLRRAGMGDNDPQLSYLLSRRPATMVTAARNDPCPCGSGRKFKTCCLEGRKETIEERAGWLYHKMITFALRPQRRDQVRYLLDTVAGRVDPEVSGRLLPVLIDLTVFEAGGIDEFVEERGELLPSDELVLAQTWLGAPLRLWEIFQVVPGQTVELRDTRTGDTLDVTERSASRSLLVGEFILARVVVVGAQHQFVGLPLHITLQQRESLLHLLDMEFDAEDMAAWLCSAFSPPRLVNREGEDLVLCTASLRPRSTPWQKLSERLDARFDGSNQNQWTETTTMDGEQVIRGFLRREVDCLTIETNSTERYERLLAVLHDEIAGDLEVVEEKRVLPSEVSSGQVEGESESGWPDDGDLPTEVADALAEFIRQKEDSWLDESIPALGGATPREAVVDPTRREDLITLLNEFDRTDPLPFGASGFDATRLRRLLGLSEAP